VVPFGLQSPFTGEPLDGTLLHDGIKYLLGSREGVGGNPTSLSSRRINLK